MVSVGINIIVQVCNNRKATATNNNNDNKKPTSEIQATACVSLLE